jgi:hypothetical protein
VNESEEIDEFSRIKFKGINKKAKKTGKKGGSNNIPTE